MEANFIIKPDMLLDMDAINMFYKLLDCEKNIKINQIINFDDWVNFALKFYDSNNIDIEKKLTLISTFVAYKELYNNTAKIVKIELQKNENTLSKLSKIKKIIRNDFAYKNDKYYVDIKNINEIQMPDNLCDLAFSKIKYEIIKSNSNTNNSKYYFAYLNYIHFSDPNYNDVIRDNKTINKIFRSHL